MNGITINDKQYIFIATSDGDYGGNCDKCDLNKDGYSLSCNILCADLYELTHGRGGYGIFKKLKTEK